MAFAPCTHLVVREDAHPVRLSKHCGKNLCKTLIKVSGISRELLSHLSSISRLSAGRTKRNSAPGENLALARKQLNVCYWN